jgi:type IX secretion system PorP/SprF family membrane protein
MKKLIFLLMLMGHLSFSQDIHFSQFNASPLNINPAFTGLFNGTGRVVLNHRNQWSNVTTPFVTSSGSYDLNFKPTRKGNDVVGVGVIINTDKAGDSEFGTKQISGSLSYTKGLDHAGDAFLSYGMQAGLAQRSLNFSKLKFDSQYNGDQYDPNLGSGEAFSSENFTFFDASAGLNFFYSNSDNYNFNFGTSLYHLNSPQQSILGDDIRLNPKLTFHTNGMIKIGSFELLPGAIFLSQGKFKEITGGTHVKLSFINNLMEKKAFYAGVWMRAIDKDAFILSLRADMNQFNVGLSYDINMSKLSAASRYQGGFEISVMFVYPKQKTSPRMKKIPCPTFM